MIEYNKIEQLKDSTMAQELLREYIYDTHPRVCEEYNISYDVDGMYRDDIESEDKYKAPKGMFLLASEGETSMGMGAFSMLSESTAEIKRFYIKPAYRNRGIASSILKQVIDRASQLGYSKLYLESSRFMVEAHALYRKFGFTETTLYEGACSRPGFEHAILFMEKEL